METVALVLLVSLLGLVVEVAGLRGLHSFRLHRLAGNIARLEVATGIVAPPVTPLSLARRAAAEYDRNLAAAYTRYVEQPRKPVIFHDYDPITKKYVERKR